MGRAEPGMEDDGRLADACMMPSFISSLEDGKPKLSRHLSAGTSHLEDLNRRFTANNSHEPEKRSESEEVVEEEEDVVEGENREEEEGDEEEEEERKRRDAGGKNNNNNNCNGAGGARRSASVAEILRRNFAESKPCSRARTDRRMQSGTEHETRPENSGNNNNNDITIKSSRYGESGKSDIETGDAGTENEPTLSPERVEHSPETHCNDNTEHVYCTVYCIEDDVKEEEERDHETISTSDVEQVAPRDSAGGSSPRQPTLYTLDDLVDPFGDLFHRLYGTGQQARTEAPVQSCRVCLEEVTPASLPCCRKAVCEECLRIYVSSQVRVGKVHISCPIPECSGYLEEGVVVSHLVNEDVAKYHYFLELSQLDSSTKPCPQCSQFTSLKEHNQNGSEHKYKIQCSNCQFVWCFKCHAPWHNGIKCREYRKGDKLLRNWASVIEHGQRNAQKCPHCKIHIQRTEGCDHMTCTQCNTNFCYRCGERYRHLRFFGDHTSNLSVFGCKYRYLPDKPHLRRLIRGSVCATKVLIAPVVLLLVVVLGALALVIGLVAFPVYYVCKRRKKQHTRVSGRWI